MTKTVQRRTSHGKNRLSFGEISQTKAFGRSLSVTLLSKFIPSCSYLYSTGQRWKRVNGSWLTAIKKLLDHSISPIILAGGLILIYDLFALKTENVVQYHRATPLLVPCVG